MLFLSTKVDSMMDPSPIGRCCDSEIVALGTFTTQLEIQFKPSKQQSLGDPWKFADAKVLKPVLQSNDCR